MNGAFIFVSILLFFSGIFCFVRMIWGPALADRVVALDFLTNILMAAVAMFSIYTKNPIYLSIVVALALVMFLGSTLFARYIEKEGRNEDQS